MDKDVVIKVEGVSKKFCRLLKRSLFYGSLDLARNMLGIRYDRKKLRPGEFMALDDMNFELRRGEALGVIGRNGSGKTTLLRVINGIFPPDSGRISVRGRIGALIAVGAGFHPHMSGRENIFLNGTILGMTRKELNEKVDGIISFADIGDFVDAPVSTYSSGMTVRLGFSIATSAAPAILLVDEILAVGDMNFQSKCMAKIGALMDAGTSIVLISHQMLNIQKICKTALLLEKGKMTSYGNADGVIAEYYGLSSSDQVFQAECSQAQRVSEHGVSCRYLKFFNARGEETREFDAGEDISVEWSFAMEKPVQDAVVHFSMGDGPLTYNGYVSLYDGVRIREIDSDTVIKLIIKNVAVSPGNYSTSIGLWDKHFIGSHYWDYESTGKIRIKPGKKIQGRFEFVHEWRIG